MPPAALGRSGDRLRRAALLVLVLLLPSLGALPVAAESRDAPCVGLVHVPGQGPSCRAAEGWEVLLEDGTRMPTHGPDVAPGPAADVFGIDPAEVPPTCANSGYAGRVIYARPSTAPDRYAEQLATMRSAVKQANGLLRMEGAELGRSLSFKIRCDASGEMAVAHAALALPNAPQTFATITQALKNAGFTSTASKYWVFYDGSVEGNFAGQGTIYPDDRLTLENHNNAASGTVPMFAIAYGTSNFDRHVIMHEATHNMGGVQNSAPRSTGGFHCIDGRDVMCYNDGGPRAHMFAQTACADDFERFDCGHDDYFHTSPPPGSYLASHWNVGSTLNRFIDFSTSCDVTGAGTLTAGGVLVAAEGLFSRNFTGIPSACAGLRYSLQSEDPTLANVNVCWFDAAGALLRCDSGSGHETGFVPAGARAARVHLFAGVQARYWFSVG